MLAQGHIERIAEGLYVEGGFRPDEAVDPMRLACALLGPDAVQTYANPRLRNDAYKAKVNGCWRFFVRAGLSLSATRFNLAHEVAEWAVERDGMRMEFGPELEVIANGVAAALLAPRAYAARAFAAKGPAWGQLAFDFGASEACVALRYGEVVGAPLCLVTRASIRYRGAPQAWPAPEALRSRRRIPGIAKTRLKDGPGRVVALVV